MVSKRYYVSLYNTTICTKSQSLHNKKSIFSHTTKNLYFLTQQKIYIFTGDFMGKWKRRLRRTALFHFFCKSARLCIKKRAAAQLTLLTKYYTTEILYFQGVSTLLYRKRCSNETVPNRGCPKWDTPYLREWFVLSVPHQLLLDTQNEKFWQAKWKKSTNVEIFYINK